MVTWWSPKPLTCVRFTQGLRECSVQRFSIFGFQPEGVGSSPIIRSNNQLRECVMLQLLVRSSSSSSSHSYSSSHSSYSAPSHSAPSRSSSAPAKSYSAPATKSASTAKQSAPATTQNTATTSKPATSNQVVTSKPAQNTVIYHTNTVYVNNNNSNDHFWTWYWLTHRNQPVQAQYQNASYTTQAAPDNYNTSDSGSSAFVWGGVVLAAVLIGAYLFFKED